jgi:hypothetical protein
MAEPSQYDFSLAEIAALLMQSAGIKEGLWSIGVNFTIAVAAAGPNKDQIRPSAVISVDHLVLAKAPEPGPLVFDAASLSAKSK